MGLCSNSYGVYVSISRLPSCFVPFFFGRWHARTSNLIFTTRSHLIQQSRFLARPVSSLSPRQDRPLPASQVWDAFGRYPFGHRWYVSVTPIPPTSRFFFISNISMSSRCTKHRCSLIYAQRQSSKTWNIPDCSTRWTRRRTRMNTAWRCTCLISGTCSLTGEFALSSDKSSLKWSP